MENSDRSSTRVRKYRKSSVPRLRWTPELHDRFAESVQKLGGRYKATPKRIMQIMAVRGLKISHIKSHLQMYRSMKKSMDSNGFIAIKNYREKKSEHITWLSLKQVSQAPTPRIQGRRKITEMGENLFYHEYQGRKGSTDNVGMSKMEEGEIPYWANINIDYLLAPQPISPINSSTSQTPINLDLTMSSH